ncbi:MAG: hypothetical protein A2082_01240 [Chloroflexi bacterium GWC2_70_10]|nr:MAG: hypothetical protein A2082_01240 [Chloroflexi bacterium GWC2_70_10]
MDALVLVLAVVTGAFVVTVALAIVRRRTASERGVRRSDGAQEVRVLVQHGYRPDRVELEAGVPAILRFDRQEEDPCSELLVCELLPSSYRLAPRAETVVRFTPTVPGTFAFTCGLGMYAGRIVVRARPAS